MATVQSLLKQACEDDGEVSYRASYSGRGMFGGECIGIVGGHADCMRLIAEVMKAHAQGMFFTAINCADDSQNGAYDEQDVHMNLVDTLLSFVADSMGHGVILYWPNLEPEADEPLTNEWIDQQSERTLLEWVAENSEYHTDEDPVENREQLRATVRMMRDRKVEDVA